MALQEIAMNLRLVVFATTLKGVSSLKRLKGEFELCLQPLFIH